MVVLLIVVAVMATLGWNPRREADISPVGYVAMAARIVFSLLVGVGLMALVFYSSYAQLRLVSQSRSSRTALPDHDFVTLP